MAIKKKFPVFWTVFIICWIVALAALFISLTALRSYLAEYESVQPKYVAETVFDEYFEDYNFTAILNFSESTRNKFETIESLAAYLAKLTDGKTLSYHEISSGMDKDTAKYIVKYEEDGKEIKIASFTLKKSGEKSKKGFGIYSLSGFELFYPANESVKIKVPSGFTPIINGIKIDESYMTESEIPSESCDHMPDGVRGIYYNIYTVDGLVSEPNVKVLTNVGTEERAAYSEDDGLYIASPVYDEALAAEFSERVITAAEVYSTYMQNDCAFAKLTPYFEKGTELYKAIRTTATTWVISHDSYEFENAEASEFYRYDENTFSCRVKLTHVLKRKNLEDFRDYVDLTLYLRNIDGTYMVYDRTNN